MLRIKFGDVLVECENEADLRAVVNVLGPRAGTVASAFTSDRPTRLGRLIEAVKGRPTAALLFHLARAGGDVSDERLLEALHLDSNTRLAGSMAGLSKQARKVGLELGDVLTRRKLKKRAGKARYIYRLRDDVAEMVRARLHAEDLPED